MEQLATPCTGVSGVAASFLMAGLPPTKSFLFITRGELDEQEEAASFFPFTPAVCVSFMSLMSLAMELGVPTTTVVAAAEVLLSDSYFLT